MSGEHTPHEVLAPAERLEAARSEINRLRAALTDTAAERDGLLVESEQRLKRGAELSLMVVDLQAERDRLEKENREFHNNWVNACDALNVVEAERDRRRNELCEMFTERDYLRAELEAIRAEKAELVAALQEIVAADEASLVELEKIGVPRSAENMRLVNLARTACTKGTATEGGDA